METIIEKALQDGLLSRGIDGYNKHYKIRGHPDIAFVYQKIAVFADGCYWHGCKICNIPISIKIQNKNIQNDARVNTYLMSRGWKVLRFWEHEIVNDPQGVVDVIERKLKEGE